jgi:hypothetical protein
MELKYERTYKKLIEDNFHKPPATLSFEEESKDGEEAVGLVHFY